MKNLNAGRTMDDPLFGSRLEVRLSMPAETFQRAERRLGLREDPEMKTWVRNVYFDTTELAMPLGHVIRARDYITAPEPFRPDDKTHFIDNGSIKFNRKFKERGSATFDEVTAMLNEQFPVRLTPFRPFVVTQYERRVFKVYGMRLTADSNIGLYWVGENGVANPVTMPNTPQNVQVEVKYLERDALGALQAIDVLKAEGAMPSIPKHSMAHTARWLEVRHRVFGTIVNELPGREYEIKFDCGESESYNRLVNAAKRGLLNGFRAWPGHDLPSRMESINEYRSVPGTDKRARVMYYGDMRPHIVMKNRGEFDEHDILLRTEERGSVLDEGLRESIMGTPVFGTSRRVKTHLALESVSTGRLYSASLDLSQADSNFDLYQIEVEYIGSQRPSSGNVEKEILDELHTLGLLVEQITGLQRSRLRKEDWIAFNDKDYLLLTK